MDFIAQKTKIFAILFLIFAAFGSIAAQSSSIYRLPAGTRIWLRMDAGINSRISSMDDTFTATVAKAIEVDDAVVLPFGTIVEGRVTKVSSADFGGVNGKMDVRFETIRFSDRIRRSIDGMLVTDLRPGSGTTGKVLAIFGGTAAGLAIGAVSGGGRSVIAGAGIGAGAGAAVAFLKKGKDVSIKTNEEFEIELKSEVTLPASDY